VGYYTSLALDTSGHPHISYLDISTTTVGLKYAHFDGSSWQIGYVCSGWGVGYYASLALDAADQPHISYLDTINETLKYAHFDGSSWISETIASTGWPGGNTSLALDADGRPHISYFDTANGALKYAHFDGSIWQIETVASAGWGGEYTSLALDANDHPHISYLDRTNQALRYAHFDGSSWISETVDSSMDAGYYTSLALDTSSQPHISYFDWWNQALKYARLEGTTWISETVDPGVPGVIGAGRYTSLALDATSRPHISYCLCDILSRQCDDLKYAYFDGTSWLSETVDAGDPPGAGWVGSHTSLALDANGHPHISYMDGTNHDLKYAWREGECVPLAGVSIQGPASLLVGEIGLYTAIYSPPTATLPLTITWDNGSVGPTVVYSWTTAGNYSITVTAANRCTVETLTATTVVTVTGRVYDIYLPLVVRGW
jgi:hypothetical protein